MKYIKTYESFNETRVEKIDEGLKEITAGVLVALSSLLGGGAKAQEIANTYNFKQPTKLEITMAHSLKQNLENESTYKQIDTLLNTAAENIGGDELADDFEQLIVTRYFDDEGNWIGKDIRQKSREDGVDKENVNTVTHGPGSTDYNTLDYEKIWNDVEISEKEVKELQNEIDQFLENLKSEIKSGKEAPELGTTYMGKINQLEDKVEKLQKKYPQLEFDGFKINQSNKSVLINTLNDFLDGDYDSEAKLSFGDSDLGYKPR